MAAEFSLSCTRPILLSLVGLALGACAQSPKVLDYFPQHPAASPTQVWPPAPETPRYRFAGELLGEQNFVASSQAGPGATERVLRWLVGLGEARGAEPRVLARPQSGMVDDTGRILVTDPGQRAVFVFDPAQGRLDIWDRAEPGTGFRSPIGIAPGPAGEVLVADAELARIVRLGPKGEPRGSLGQGVLGRPTGLARDAARGLIYVADTAEHDIKVFGDDGALRRRIGRRGRAAGQFNAPTHLAFARDRLYVSDTLNARILVLSREGEPIRSIGQRGLYVGNLTRPKGITVDRDGHIYVVESYYDHLLVFDQQGHYLLPIGGTGTGTGQFFLPAGAWSDSSDRIFVADMFNGRVMIFHYLSHPTRQTAGP